MNRQYTFYQKRPLGIVFGDGLIRKSNGFIYNLTILYNSNIGYIIKIHEIKSVP